MGKYVEEERRVGVAAVDVDNVDVVVVVDVGPVAVVVIVCAVVVGAFRAHFVFEEMDDPALR